MVKVNIEVYGYFADIAGVKKQAMEVGKPTVHGLLEEMSRSWSRQFMEFVWDENQKLTPHIVIYVNSMPIFHQQGLETRLEEGGKVIFMQPMEGGER